MAVQSVETIGLVSPPPACTISETTTLIPPPLSMLPSLLTPHLLPAMPLLHSYSMFQKKWKKYLYVLLILYKNPSDFCYTLNIANQGEVCLLPRTTLWQCTRFVCSRIQIFAFCTQEFCLESNFLIRGLESGPNLQVLSYHISNLPQYEILYLDFAE